MARTFREGIFTPGKLLLLAIICGSIGLFYYLGLTQYLSLDHLIKQRTSLNDYYSANPYKTAAAFFTAHVLLTGLSLPVSALMMVVSGVIFGLLWGTIIASFASVTGSTIAFLCSRYLLKDIVLGRYSEKLKIINKEMATDGIYYLLLMRLTPLVPSFLISILMGVTSIGVAGFYLTSQIGMLPGTIVFVNAGTQLATINTLADILSAPLIGAFVLAGAFPLLVRKTFLFTSKRRKRSGNTK